jgi:hypothetical protein
MTVVEFTKDDFDNLEIVREIVFRRLREGVWNQLYDNWEEHDTGKLVRFESRILKDRFYILMNEVMWQLIIQNVITPGLNASNPELPWFRVTSYGKEVLAEEHFSPHDPTGYLDEFGNVAISDVGKVARPYIEEALRCYNAGCHAAALLMVGVGAEAVFLQLCKVIEPALKSKKERNNFEKLQWVKPKHRWVIAKFEQLPSPQRKQLPESLDLTLTSLYDLIRRQRNELGHPSGKLPDIGREKAFVYFRMFPSFVGDVEAFAKYCRQNSI